MRVGIVVPEFHTERSVGGGLESVAKFFARSLEIDDLFTLEFVSVRMASDAPESRRMLAPGTWVRGPVARRGQVDGVPTWYVGAGVAELEPVRYWPTRRLRSLWERFDALLVVGGSPIAFNLARGFDGPVVGQVATTVRAERSASLSAGSWLRRLISRAVLGPVERLEERGATVPDVVLVENPRMVEYFRQVAGPQVELLEPSVDELYMRPPIPAVLSRGSGEDGYLLSVGRLNDPRKNFSGLLRAYARAREERGVREKLVIAGLHHLDAESCGLIDSLGLTGSVKVVESPTGPELRELYVGALGFVLASHEEGLGIVLLEAMASRTPVIATATVGARHVLADGQFGTIVPLDDSVERGLAIAMGDLSAQPELRSRLAAAGLGRVRTTFDPQAAGARLRDLLVGLGRDVEVTVVE